MAIKETIQVLDAMVADGVIERYAIAGAVAAYNYVEPTVTEDLDILVSFDQSGLISLAPVFSYLRGKGYNEFRAEGVLIGDWPVQFLPVADALDAEALDRMEEVDVGTGDSRLAAQILRPEYLVAIALRVGRPKDIGRIAQFLQEDAVDVPALCDVLQRHGLQQRWHDYCRRTAITDPCAISEER
jgi:hypothetical protein